MTMHIQSSWLERIDAPFSAVETHLFGARETAENRATLGEIEVVADDVLLTEAVDQGAAQPRRGANLPAYQMAKWLAWHWWRLRWEMRSPMRWRHDAVERRRGVAPDTMTLNWHAAHNLGELGDGWLWPAIIFESDGEQMAMRVGPSSDTPTEPLRFLGDRGVVVAASDWERSVEAFVEGVLSRLADCELKQTDLGVMWRELKEEQADLELTAYRKIEARLGFDVDEADAKAIERIHKAGADLGHAAMLEVVADRPVTVAELKDAARQYGFQSQTVDRPKSIGDVGNVGYGEHNVPWHVGVDAARHLRKREGLGDGPIRHPQLAELCAIPKEALTRQQTGASMAFSLRQRNADRIVLRAKWQTGRRFEAARLLGDGLMVEVDERLRPATATATYRQKVQRAFAAEFLCPIESLVDSLDDFSEDAQRQAAERFRVSQWVVATQLVNNGYMPHQGTRDWELAA